MNNKVMYIRKILLDRVVDVVKSVTGKDLSISTTLIFEDKKYYVVPCSNSLGTKIKQDEDNIVQEFKTITNSTNGRIFVKTYKKNRTMDGFSYTEASTSLKLGKIIRSIYSSFTDVEIEKVVSEWKKMYIIDTSIVQVTDDIEMVYNMLHVRAGDLGGSCMRQQGGKMKIYEDLGCSIAYIENNNGLLARSIVWNEVEDRETGERLVLHDRIFSSDENSKLTLQTYFKEKDIEFIDDYDVHTIKNVKGNYYDELPYIDNMCSLGAKYILNNYGDDTYGCLQNTDGSYTYHYGSAIGEDIGTSCECCGDRHHEDDMYYVYEYGYVCDSCVDEFPYCADIEERVPIDDAWYCESSGNYYCYDNYKMYLYDKKYYVHIESSMGGEAFWCEDIQEYVSSYCIVYRAEDSDEYFYDKYNLYYIEETDEYYYDHDNYLARLEELKD